MPPAPRPRPAEPAPPWSPSPVRRPAAADAATTSEATGSRLHRVPLRGVVRIGRSPENDVVLAEPNVSRHHCEVRAGDTPSVVDLGGVNGTRVGPERVPTRGARPLRPGEGVGVGPFRLRFDGSSLTVVDERVGMHLEARDVVVRAGERTILHPTSLSVAPGELVALIGQSGAGKSTLLRALAADRELDGGEVLLARDPVALRTPDVGYVPQTAILHDALTLREALTFAARLRLPQDTAVAEIDDAVRRATADLRLDGHEDTRVGALSGGQRTRAAAAVELLGRPTMLLLDEPTSGLDPGLERAFMELLRRLADDGRGVVVVTHATRSLELCDTVAVMARGGHLRYLGPPRDALAELGARDHDDLYRALDDEPAAPVALPAPTGRRPRAAPTAAPSRGRSPVRQAAVLTARYARTFLRDRRTLAVLLGQVPIIAVAIGTLHGRGLLERPDVDPGRSAQYAFLLVTAAVWVGLVSACREIVKERTVVERERAVGVGLGAYLASKLVVLLALGAVQVALLLLVAGLVQPLGADPPRLLLAYVVLVLATWASTGVGLLVSALARNPDQAVSVVPLLLVPQLLYAGALLPVAAMGAAAEAVSLAVGARWAFAGLGSVLDMNGRFAEDRRFAAVNDYGEGFFATSPVVAVLVLAAFLAVSVGLTGLALRRRRVA